jgi:hypothetical protein
MKIVVLLVLLFSAQAVNWQAKGNMSADNMT